MTTPTKTTDDPRRVYRGGSWSNTTATNERAAYRVVDTPMVRLHVIGFRTAQTGCRMLLKGRATP